LKRPNYPNCCFTLDLPNLSSIQALSVEFKRYPGYTGEILIEDKAQASHRNTKASHLAFSGPPLIIEDLGSNTIKALIIEYKQSVFMEHDPSKKCHYPNKYFKSYKDCDNAYMGRMISQFYPSGFMGYG
jgi:hypothetical protein